MDKNDLVKFRSECLSSHNFYRSLHATTPLIWSNKLADGAQRWAEELASADSLSYSHERGVGENIACLWGSDVTGNKITQIWYEEAQHFDYTEPRVTPITRPFCQVVWEGTRELGAGKSTTKNGKHIVVARYNPPATRRNADKNVKRPRLDKVDGDSSLLLGQSLGVRKFQEECLFAHNEFRVLHGSPPLHWSPSLAWAAQQWAEELVRMGELKHNDDEMIGENLAGMVGDELTGKECTDMWYDEVAEYDYNNPGYSEDTSNFTQVVWIGSELFGVGRATFGDLCVVVAFYEPPGNMEGLFGDNVRKAGSKVKTYRLIKETKTFIPPSPDLDWFRVECLVAHNYFRARHAATPLVITHTLNEEAQYWAERLLVTGATEDLQDSRIGINVAVIEGQQHVSGLKVTELWYQESTGYDFNSPGFNLSTRSFTQLLWLTSRKLGVGKASNETGQCVVVARYEPVGNIDGLFVSNVRRRGHERNALEPMLFESDVKYRIKVEGRRSLRMSWEIEGAMIQADNKHHENARRKERAQPAYMSSPENFTRLVWIESPVLPRRRMRPESSDLEKDDRSDEDKESGVEEGEEFDNEEPLFTVVHATEEENVEPCFEHAFVYTEPTRTAYYPDVRRSLSLDSQGTEPEPEEGRVLSRVSYFEQLEKMEESPQRTSTELKHEVKKTDEHEENVCQLEFDDVFPKHDENDERDHDFASDEEADDDDDDGMSLETVSEADEDLMADLDEFEMDHHIKSYCYEENFVNDITTDKAEEDHEPIDNRGECASSPDHCVAVSIKREDAAEEELKRVEHIFEFVPRDHEKRQKEIDLNKIDLSETEIEQELFKFEAHPEKTQKPSGPPCTEVVEESNRNKLEQPLDLDEAFSSTEESETLKAKPPPTLPKPQRPKQQTKTETVETNKVIITEQTTEIVPHVKDVHSIEICKDLTPSEVRHETAPLNIETKHTIEQREVHKATTLSEQDEHFVTEKIREERHLQDSTERFFPHEEEEEETKEEKKDSMLEEHEESYEVTEIRDANDDEVFDDGEVLEVIDISHIDRDRKVNRILNRLGRQIDLIPLEEPPKKGEISKYIDLSETDEEKVLFDVFTPSSMKRTWSSSTVDEGIITPIQKQSVECSLDLDEIFKDEEKVQQSEPKEETPTPREKRRSVSFKETVIIQDYESVREEPLQQEDDQYQYCEEESEEDVETFGDEYDDEIATKSDDVKEISSGKPVFLSHEVEETTEIVCDEHEAEEEDIETFEEEDTSMLEAAIEDSPHPVHLSEELSKDNEYDTCDLDNQEPIGSVADVYEEYEKSYASPVDQGTYVTPVHVAAEVQSHDSVETASVKSESILPSTYDSFEEVHSEASSSRVVVPSSCHVTAEMEVRHSEVQPVEEAEVDTLQSEEEPEETIESAIVRGIPESTESVVCMTTETTYHQKTEVIYKRAPSIEVDTYNDDELISAEESSYKDIIPNGHCTSTHISHDAKEETHEAVVQSEKESYTEETSEQLEDSEVRAVPFVNIEQLSENVGVEEELEEDEEEKDQEEDDEQSSENEILESRSVEEVHVRHFEEPNEEVFEKIDKRVETAEEEPEIVDYGHADKDEEDAQSEDEHAPVVASSPPKSPSSVLVTDEKIEDEREETAEEEPEIVDYARADEEDAESEDEHVAVVASSPPRSPSPILLTDEKIEDEREETAEEEPEIADYGHADKNDEDTQSEDEHVPVVASSLPRSPSPILLTDAKIEDEREETAEEEPEIVDYGHADEEDTESEDEQVPVVASSPPKSPSSVLVEDEKIEDEREETAEEEPEIVDYGHADKDEEDAESEDEHVPVVASSPPRSASPVLVTDEKIEDEREETAEEEPEIVDYGHADKDEEDAQSEDEHVPVVASSPPRSPSPVLVTDEKIEDEREETAEEEPEIVDCRHADEKDAQSEDEQVPVVASSLLQSPSPVLVTDEKIEDEREETAEEEPEIVDYRHVDEEDAQSEDEHVPVVASSPPKSPSPVLVTDEKIEDDREETAEEEPEIVDYGHADEEDAQSEDEHVPVVVLSPPKSPSPILVTDAKIEDDREETAEEDSEIVDYGHADEKDAQSEDEQVPVVASSPPKSPSPVLVTDEKIEDEREETAEEEPEIVDYGHADEEDAQSEDEPVPVVASSPPRSPSPVLVTVEKIEDEREETVEQEPEIVGYGHADKEDAQSEDELIPVVTSSTLIEDVVDEEKEVSEKIFKEAEKPVESIEAEQVEEQEQIDVVPEPKTTYERQEETIELEDGGHVSKVVTREETSSVQEGDTGDEDGMVAKKSVIRKIVTTTTTTRSQFLPEEHLSATEVEQDEDTPEEVQKTEDQQTELPTVVCEELEKEEEKEAEEALESESELEQQTQDEILAEEKEQQVESDEENADEILKSQPQTSQDELKEDWREQDVEEAEPEKTTTIQKETIELEDGGLCSKTVTREEFATVKEDDSNDDDNSVVSKTITRRIMTTTTTTSRTQYTNDEPLNLTKDDQVEETPNSETIETEQAQEQEQEPTAEELEEDREEILETRQEEIDDEDEKHTAEHMLVNIQQASKVESVTEQTELEAQEVEPVASKEESGKEHLEQVDSEKSESPDVDHLLQPKPSDDRFGYISEEELEETEELYVALRESFQEQEYEEKVDVDNVCIEETTAVVDEKFEPSEDDIAYDSEVITEVEKEITSALVVKESFSSAVCDDEQGQESSEEAEPESDEESKESLVQFDEIDKVEEQPDQEEELEESPGAMEESEEVESSDETDKVQLIEFTEDTEKEQDDEFEQEEELEEDDEEEDVFEEDEEGDEEIESSGEMMDENVELVQFSERDDDKIAALTKEPSESHSSAANDDDDDDDDDDEKDLDSSEENADKSVELIQFSEQDEVTEEETSVQYVNMDEVEEEEKEAESSEELVEESVELIQFSETSEEEKIVEFDENSKEEIQYEEKNESSEEENTVHLVQFSEQKEKTKIVEEVYDVQQTEQAELSPPYNVTEELKSEDETSKEETLIHFSGEEVEEEVTQEERRVPPCIPILLTECEKTEQEEEVELYMLKDEKDGDFINISGEPLACSTPIYATDDRSFDDSGDNVFGENYEAIEKIIAHNESDELEHSFEVSHDDSYHHVEAEEIASRAIAETEELDDSLQSPRKEVAEETLTETKQSKVESIDLSALEDTDQEISSSHQDHVSPPPTIIATEFVADEEEEGSDEEYIPHFDHPRTYMVENKELLIDSTASDTVDSSVKMDFTNDTEDPSEVSTTSELSEAIQQESDVMSFHATDLHSEPKDELEEEDQERIQRKHQKMEEVFLKDEMDAERSEQESRQEGVVTEKRHEERTTLVTYTTATVSTVTIQSDTKEEHSREEIATMIMEADEQKLEKKEPKPEHVEEHEAMTEDDFRSDGTPSKSDESFDDLDKTIDEEDTLFGVYQEELEVSKLEHSFEEQHTETQESAPIDIDVAFTEEVEIERALVVEEVPEVALEKVPDEEKQAEDVYQEEVEVQRVDDYRNKDVFEEEIEVRRVEEQHTERTFEMEEEAFEEAVAVYEEELEIKAEPETSEDDSAGILLAEPISSDAERDEGHTSEEEEIVQAEPVRDQAQESDSPESDQQQELEEYEIEEQDHAIPHEMQGTDEQEHLYDSNNNQSMTRYYVDFSPAGSFERDSTASEGEYPEVYRQGEPMEEDMEEFILVKYGHQHEHSDSSGEEDLSEHREMYVIPEEDSEDRAQHTDDEEKNDTFEEQKQEPDETVFYEQGFMNPALEDINEDEEEGQDDNKDKKSPKEDDDDEEKRQLEEYERLESFVMLEEKLSQVESGESLEDLTSGTDNKRASSDETLNDDDDLANTMNTSSTLKESQSNEGSGEESNNELEKTLTTEEEEIVDLDDGGVLTKRTVREESYSLEEDAGSDDDDDDDKDRTLTRKRVARKVITTTTTSETHVTKTPSEDQQSNSDDEKDDTPKETIVIEEIPSDEEETKPEKTSTFETEQETIELDDGGTVSKVVTREETCTFDNDGDNGDNDSVVQRTMTRRIVTTTTTRTSRTTQLSDQPLCLTDGDENANQMEESSSSETHETVIKSRQHGDQQAVIDQPAKRQLSREGSGSFPEQCAEPLRKRLAKRFDSRDSLEGHSSEFSADSTGESTSKSSEDLISDDDYPGLDEFQRDCIRQHNIYRHQHRACRLVWSEDLAKDARAWADHLASTNTLEHSSDKDHGENLASAKGYELRGDKVAEMWYAEIEDYSFETPAFNAKCGHFTQMIWKDTKEFGVAKSVTSDGSQYVVARYYPPGNVVGEFKNCIRRARGQRSSVRKRRRSSTRRRISQTDGVDPVSQQEKFKNECVVSHNYYRSLHGAQPLQWSTRLAIESQNFAEKLAQSGSFMHSGDKNVGECLAFSFGLELSGRDAVDSWYDEIVDYDYEFPGFTSHTANFTQLVWQESREFGMGKAIGEDGSCVVVGRYYPPGNQVGCFQDNVKAKQPGYF